MSQYAFHPAVQSWFDQSFDQATPVQEAFWASIAKQQHTYWPLPPVLVKPP